MDKNIKSALLFEMHKAINESSNSATNDIENLDLTYPPGIDFTSSELLALKNMDLSGDAKSALKKIITDACSYPLFQLFSLLDGVADPNDINEWCGLTLTNKNEQDEEMLHDDFYESFHDYQNKC